MKLKDVHSQDITLLLEGHILPAVLNILPKDTPHKGGWFCLGELCMGHDDNEYLEIVLHASIGDPTAMHPEARFFTLEKAKRLAFHGHRSSRESADETNKHYPGALRYDNRLAGSFSGFPAAVDEAIVAIIGVQRKFVDEETIWEYLGEEGRDYYIQIVKQTPFSSKFVQR